MKKIKRFLMALALCATLLGSTTVYASSGNASPSGKTIVNPGGGKSAKTGEGVYYMIGVAGGISAIASFMLARKKERG